MIFGRNLLIVKIQDQPGYEITVIRSSVKSIEIVPTVHNDFVFQSGRRNFQLTTVTYETNKINITAIVRNTSDLQIFKSNFQIERYVNKIDNVFVESHPFSSICF